MGIHIILMCIIYVMGIEYAAVNGKSMLPIETTTTIPSDNRLTMQSLCCRLPLKDEGKTTKL